MTTSVPDADPESARGYGGWTSGNAALVPATEAGLIPSSGLGLTAADPVRGLLHRYRELCVRAVDPLEIAAGLEVRGVTDRTAECLQYRDVFSLAEALYDQAPHNDEQALCAAEPLLAAARPRTTPATALRAVARAVLPLFPGVLCTALVAALTVLPPALAVERAVIATLGAAAVLLAGWLALRPLKVNGIAVVPLCWLGGYALYGDALLTALLRGDLPAVSAMAPSEVALSLAFAVAPAVWCTHWFSSRAGRKLLSSSSLAAFAAGARPLFLLALGMFTAASLTIQGMATLAVGVLPWAANGGTAAAPPGALLSAAALGLLLFLALLLASHGFSVAAGAAVGVACGVEAVVLGWTLAARLPALAPSSWPLEAVVSAHGPAVVPAVACAGTVIVLLVYARRVLTSASAHYREATW